MTAEKHKSQRSETVLVGEGRIAFPFVHEKRTKSAAGAPLDNPRYDAVFLMPKTHTDPLQCTNYKLLAGLCVEAATKAWGSFPQGGKWPIQDGDVPHQPKPKPGVTPLTAEQIAAKNSWRKGQWVIEVTTNLEPGPRVAVLQNGVATEIPARVVAGQVLYKSGDYGYVSLNAFTFHNQTFGVNFGFEGVLFTKAGEPIGSSGPRSAAQMFGAVANMAPAAAPPTAAPPVPGQVPSPPVAPPPGGPPMSPAAPPLQNFVVPVAAPVGGPPMPPATAGGPPLPPIPGR